MHRLRLLAVLLTLTVLAVPSAAGSGTGAIVISQLFGGGANAGAPFASDYVELFNRSSSPVDVGGWTVQYATAAGTTWQATALAGTIQPGRYYLVELAGGTTGSVLPTPDATGSTNLSATSGKIALVRGTEPLSCGSAPGSCSGAPLVEDLVGYGTASDYEGAGAVEALTSTTAALRAGDGCTDTDSNGADLVAGAPAPRNSASTANACAGPAPPGGASDAKNATVELDVEAVLSLSLERATLSFGATTSGLTPAPISERVTVLSNHAAGYTLSVERSAFAPNDLPLALRSASAPAGGALGPALVGGGLAPVPITPATLTIGTTSATSPAAGDVWPAEVGFSGPIPSVAPGRYSATLTFTVIGR
jgi:hypothetical protein